MANLKTSNIVLDNSQNKQGVKIHTLDNQFTIQELQAEAIQIHRQHVFMLNNDIQDHASYARADQDYQYLLGTIEEQINNLFI